MKIDVEPAGEAAAFFGKGGWSYLQNDSNRFTDYYSGVLAWSPEQTRQARKIIAERASFLDGMNIRYEKFVVPEKMCLYPEYLPDRLAAVPESAARPAVQLTIKNPSARYLRDYLAIHKPLGLLYYRGDTHPNASGSYLIYKYIALVLRKKFGDDYRRPMKLRQLQATLATHYGDLAKKIPGDEWPDDAKAFSPAGGFEHVINYAVAQPKAQRVENPYQKRFKRPCHATEIPGSPLPKAVVFHDSMAERVNPLLAEQFSRAVFIWHAGEVYRDIILAERPDVVIHIMAERFVTTYPRRRAFHELG